MLDEHGSPLKLPSLRYINDPITELCVYLDVPYEIAFW